MVSNITLLHMQKRLCEIFGCSEELTFAGKSETAVGDFMHFSNNGITYRQSIE